MASVPTHTRPPAALSPPAGTGIWTFRFGATINTYSAGEVSFTFYDLNGNAIQPGAIQAYFTHQFPSNSQQRARAARFRRA